MQKRKQLQYAVVSVLGFALLFMTIGFAAYAQLTSKDAASAASRVTPIHKVGFDASSYLESDTSVVAAEKAISSDEINFTVNLSQPGDTYAAMLNIVNNGNIIETIDQITMNGLDESLADYVDFRLSYDDEDYIGTSYNVDSDINLGETGRKQLFVTVTYKEDAKNIGPLNLNLSAGLVFAD